MARIRTVKPDFWTDEKLGECSIGARLLFIGLISHADDEGRMSYSPKRIKMQVFPSQRDRKIDVMPLLAELIEHELVIVYEIEGEPCLTIPGFTKHQKIYNKTASKIPPFQGNSGNFTNFQENSRNFTKIPELSEKKPTELEGNGTGMEGKGKDKSLSLSEIGEHEAAKKVQIELAMSGNESLMLVLDAVRFFIHANKCRAQDAADSLVMLWNMYDTLDPPPKFKCGKYKFFKEGRWKNPDAWREDEQPSKAQQRQLNNRANIVEALFGPEVGLSGDSGQSGATSGGDPPLGTSTNRLLGS